MEIVSDGSGFVLFVDLRNELNSLDMLEPKLKDIYSQFSST